MNCFQASKTNVTIPGRRKQNCQTAVSVLGAGQPAVLAYGHVPQAIPRFAVQFARHCVDDNCTPQPYIICFCCSQWRWTNYDIHFTVQFIIVRLTIQQWPPPYEMEWKKTKRTRKKEKEWEKYSRKEVLGKIEIKQKRKKTDFKTPERTQKEIKNIGKKKETKLVWFSIFFNHTEGGFILIVQNFHPFLSSPEKMNSREWVILIVPLLGETYESTSYTLQTP